MKSGDCQPGSRAGWAGTETSEAAGAVLVLVTLPGTMRGHLALLTRDPGNPGITIYLTALKYLIIHLQQLF